METQGRMDVLPSERERLQYITPRDHSLRMPYHIAQRENLSRIHRDFRRTNTLMDPFRDNVLARYFCLGG